MLTVLADAMMYAARQKSLHERNHWDAPKHWYSDHPSLSNARRRAETRAWLTRTGLK